MNRFYLLIFSFLISCQSCMKEYVNAPIAREYDLVLGILAPDTAIQFTREYPVEVFVGKMIPASQDNEFEIQGMEDPMLFQMLLDNRLLYRCYYKYHDDAKVTIKSSVAEVTLISVGYGIFRDVNHALHIKSDSTYELTVKVPGHETVYAKTKVLKNIYFTSPVQDTLYEPITYANGGDSIYTEIAEAKDQLYFRTVDSSSNSTYNGIDLISYTLCSFSPKSRPYYTYHRTLSDTTKIYEVKASLQTYSISKELGNFWQPTRISYPLDFEPFYNSLYDYDITGRSTVKGGGFVGVFGSYNATVKKLVLIPIWSD